MFENELLTACYHQLLVREPDAIGLEAWNARIRAENLGPEAVIASFLQSDEFRHRAAKDFLSVHAPEARDEVMRQTALADHSQNGELVALVKLMVNAGARHKIVVDVGARGRDRSNSFDLLNDFGWRGLLIEANTKLIPEIEAAFAGRSCKVLNLAVSDYSGRTQMYLGVNEDISSLNPAATSAWGDIHGSIEVQVERLGTILTNENIPPDFDLLSIDIEGEDVRVLNDMIATSPYRPIWVIIEASQDFGVKTLEQAGLSPAVAAAYDLVGQTRANLILRRRPR